MELSSTLPAGPGSAAKSRRLQTGGPAGRRPSEPTQDFLAFARLLPQRRRPAPAEDTTEAGGVAASGKGAESRRASSLSTGLNDWSSTTLPGAIPSTVPAPSSCHPPHFSPASGSESSRASSDDLLISQRPPAARNTNSAGVHSMGVHSMGAGVLPPLPIAAPLFQTAQERELSRQRVAATVAAMRPRLAAIHAAQRPPEGHPGGPSVPYLALAFAGQQDVDGTALAGQPVPGGSTDAAALGVPGIAGTQGCAY